MERYECRFKIGSYNYCKCPSRKHTLVVSQILVGFVFIFVEKQTVKYCRLWCFLQRNIKYKTKTKERRSCVKYEQVKLKHLMKNNSEVYTKAITFAGSYTLYNYFFLKCELESVYRLILLTQRQYSLS